MTERSCANCGEKSEQRYLCAKCAADLCPWTTNEGDERYHWVVSASWDSDEQLYVDEWPGDEEGAVDALMHLMSTGSASSGALFLGDTCILEYATTINPIVVFTSIPAIKKERKS